MRDFESFTVKLYERFYIIKPVWNTDCVMYEIFTNCDKLFTLRKTNGGNWITNESDVIPINNELVDDLGEALEEHEVSSEL